MAPWMRRGPVVIVGAAALLVFGLYGRSERSGPAPWTSRTMETVHGEVEVQRAAAPLAPNVVVIIGCTVRKDQLGLYGGLRGTTPYLDEVSGRAVVFDDVVTAAPWTKPASVALLTGRHALSVGMIEPGRRRNAKSLPSNIPTLATRFARGGWTTLGATANPNLHSTFGFDQGFETYLQPATLWRDGGAKLPGRTAAGELLLAAAQRPQGKPLYLQALFVDAHGPYSAGRKERQLDSVSAYRAALGRFDSAVKQLVVGLADLGIDETNTLFVVVNDHGEGLGMPAHHGKSHGRFLAPSVVGGVWMTWGHGASGPRRVGGMASQVDLTPTLLELSGLGLARFDGAGLSHADAVRGIRPKTGRERAYSDTWFTDTNRAAVYTEDLACQHDFSGGDAGRFESGCFDRHRDPEHADVLANPGGMEGLLAWRAEHSPVLEGGSDEAPDASVSEEVSRQLEALGYVDEAP